MESVRSQKKKQSNKKTESNIKMTNSKKLIEEIKEEDCDTTETIVINQSNSDYSSSAGDNTEQKLFDEQVDESHVNSRTQLPLTSMNGVFDDDHGGYVSGQICESETTSEEDSIGCDNESKSALETMIPNHNPTNGNGIEIGIGIGELKNENFSSKRSCDDDEYPDEYLTDSQIIARWGRPVWDRDERKKMRMESDKEVTNEPMREKESSRLCRPAAF